MRITATLKICGGAKELKQLFESENSGLKNDRASYKFKAKGKFFFIAISASDSTAFRAIISSISKLLSIYEKTGEVIDNEN